MSPRIRARIAAGRIASLVALAAVSLVGPLVAVAPPARGDDEVTPASQYLDASHPILFVFDTSGSMGEADDQGVPKLEGAKSSTIEVIYGLPATANVGVWAYPKGGGCEPGISVLDVDALDRSTLTAEIQALQPGGQTPTAAALRAATDSLKSRGFTAGTIMLVSDGLANCNVDPCETAKEIATEGFNLTANTAGFNIDAEGRQQLECIAQATGGVYVDIANSDELTQTLAAASQAALQLEVTGLDATARSGGAHTITARITNTNPSIPAAETSITLSFRNGQNALYPAVLPPRLQLGNIPPGASVARSWTISTGVPGNAYGLVVAQAIGLTPVQKTGTVRVVDSDATLNEAGSILRDAQRIAVLGDSYSSGEGTYNYVDMDTASAACHRSLDAYGLRLYGVTNDDVLVACSGAVTADFHSPNPDRGREAQRSYLYDLFKNPDTAPQVVLLTFGGNDIGFADIVKRCAEPDDCSQLYTGDTLVKDLGVIEPNWAPQQYQAARNMKPTLVTLYESIYDTIRRSSTNGAPQIPIVVLPYLQILTNTLGDGCSNMNNNERQFGVQLLSNLNRAIEESVAEARANGIPVHYAKDVVTAVLPGHTACADRPQDRYVNSLDIAKALTPSAATTAKCTTALADLEPLTKNAAIAWCASGYKKDVGAKAQEMMHPNTAGHRAVANALVDWSNRPEVEAEWASDKATPIDTSGLLRVTDILNRTLVTVDTTVNMTQLQGSTTLSNGGKLTVQGSGFAPNSNTRIVVRSTPRALGTATADDAGSITSTVIIPNDLPRGPHTVEIEGFDPDGNPLLLQQPIVVRPAIPLWVILIALIAITALAAAAAIQIRGRRHGFGQRNPSRRPERDSA